jgi:DNA-cytosine methyltransferase
MKLSQEQIEHGITVLSLFDGMACGLLALKKAGIKVKAYYASEIDKDAMKVAKDNHPEIIHIGSVSDVSYVDGTLFTLDETRNVGKIDMLIGGSPCTSFSKVGKRLNFEDPRGKLFFEYTRIKEETNPTWFLLENVRMKSEWQAVITEYVGVEPNMINSALVSAQNRPRLYWTNIDYDRDIKDRGILLRDILQPEEDVEDKFYLSPEANAYMERSSDKWDKGNDRWYTNNNKLNHKAHCLTANMYKGVPYGCMKELNRKLTPIECERLQGVPDLYTVSVSNSQRYKMLGNGWTVDVIVHILNGIKDDEVTYEDRYMVLTRKDLRGVCANKPIGEIYFHDFKRDDATLHNFRRANFVIFIDTSGEHKILKCRYTMTHCNY